MTTEQELLLMMLLAATVLAVGGFLVVRAARRAARRAAARQLASVRSRALGVRALVQPAAAPRRDLARDLAAARQAWAIAHRDRRPVADLERPLLALERAARTLDVDLRLVPYDGLAADVARVRSAARQLQAAIAVAGSPAAKAERAALLDEICSEAERVRLTAQAHTELLGD